MSNNIKIIASAEEIGYKNWDDFVNNHPNGNIFQSHAFYKIYKIDRFCEPIVLAALSNGVIMGLLLANIRKEFCNVLGNFTTRAIVIGGPLIKNNDEGILERILDSLKKLVKSKAIYIQFRNLFYFYEQKNIFQSSGLVYIDHLDIIVDLSKSENLLWKEISPKAKNRIRNAMRKDTKFVVEDSMEAFVKCYDILKEVYMRIKIPLPDFSYFLNIYNVLKLEKSKLLIFTVQNEGLLIGCMLAVGFNETLYGLYNGAYSAFYDKSPNDLIPWEVYKWGKNNGYKKFDWLGAGNPNDYYGVRKFKMKFGGELKNYGRFEIINKPILYKIGKVGLKLYPRVMQE